MIYIVDIIRRFGNIVLAYLKKTNWEGLLFVFLVLISPFMAFYNLELNPRPWQDEGSYLTLAKTLAEDGVYAVKNSDGYQTFGAIQSVGPTAIVPVAWAFRVFGAGLLNGRIVSGIYMLISVMIFYFASLALFGRRTALFAILLLIVSPSTKFILYGRPLLGETSALGFFLAGWLAWSYGVRKRMFWLQILSGVCFGGAIVTKNQYLLISFASMGILILMDLFYYRLGEFKGLITVGIIAAGCVAAWYGWQVVYFGDDVFLANLLKIRDLASVTAGFSLRSSIDAIRFLFGSGSGYMYIFWGGPALIYTGILASRRTRDSFSLAFLVIFTSLWLVYFTFLVIPWSRYIFPASAILAIFVGKLFIDLLAGFCISFQETWLEVKEFTMGNSNLSSRGMISLGAFLAMFILILWAGYHLQKAIRDDVLDKTGAENTMVYSPLGFSEPGEMADFLNEHVSKDEVIETWERELGILTEHRYHFPDQSLLGEAHKIVYRGSSNVPEYAILSGEYFESVKPDYVIVGWYAKTNHIYDINYLLQHATLIKAVGSETWGYELYIFNKKQSR